MPSPKSDVEALFLTSDQICDRYSLTRAQLRQITARWDSPPFIVLGLRIVRYDAAEFDRWFRSHTVGTSKVLEPADTS
jgi:predicted DNA-binding transcriptional regulator AlpA